MADLQFILMSYNLQPKVSHVNESIMYYIFIIKAESGMPKKSYLSCKMICQISLKMLNVLGSLLTCFLLVSTVQRTNNIIVV